MKYHIFHRNFAFLAGVRNEKKEIYTISPDLTSLSFVVLLVHLLGVIVNCASRKNSSWNTYS